MFLREDEIEKKNLGKILVKRNRSRNAIGTFLFIRAVIGFAVVLRFSWVSTASAEPQECASPNRNAPILVTEDCVDPMFPQPVVDVDEWRDLPVPHRYVNGHFEGTENRF